MGSGMVWRDAVGEGEEARGGGERGVEERGGEERGGEGRGGVSGVGFRRLGGGRKDWAAKAGACNRVDNLQFGLELDWHHPQVTVENVDGEEHGLDRKGG